MLKHENITCERCGKRMECKVNAFSKCQCSTVQLNLNEIQYVSEHYEGCLCAACLIELKEEYRVFFKLRIKPVDTVNAIEFQESSG